MDDDRMGEAATKMQEMSDVLDRYASQVRSSNRAAIGFMIALPMMFFFAFIVGLWVFAP